jgi:hypothetical protein
MVTEKTVNQQEVENYMSGQDYRIVSEEMHEQCSKVFDELDV